MKTKIVVGVDGSEAAHRAIEWCAAYAPALDAEVVAVHAIGVPFDASPTSENLPSPLVPPEGRAEIAEHITTVWCAPLANAAVSYRVLLIDGEPAPGIIEAAKTEHADLVVTGRRGRGGLAELVLGSTSHTLIHHLDRPIVIVP